MKHYRLGEICNIVSGGTPSRSNTSFWEGGTIPWIKIGNISQKYVNTADEYITQEGLDGSSAKMLPSGTILYTIFATLGEVGILSIDACTNQAIAGLTIRNLEQVRTDYIYYYLKSRKVYVSNLGRGVAQNNINMSILRDFDVPLPSIEQQDEIITVLEKTSAVIEGRKEELGKLDDLIKARFVEMFGDPRNNSRYNYVSFEELVEYMGDIGSNGANKVVTEHLDMKDEEDYALMVRFLNFTKNDFTDDVKYISQDAYEFFKKSQIFGGELIICKIGSAGQNYVMPSLNRPVSLGLNQIMVRINDKVLMPYLYQYLHTEYGESLISGCINGAVTKSITKTELKKIPVMLPSKDEQRQFASFVEQVDKSKDLIQKSIYKTQLLFDSLMQEYFA